MFYDKEMSVVDKIVMILYASHKYLESFQTKTIEKKQH